MINLLADRSSLKDAAASPPTAASHNKNNINSREKSFKIINLFLPHDLHENSRSALQSSTVTMETSRHQSLDYASLLFYFI